MSSFRRISGKNSSNDEGIDVPTGFKIPGVKSWINNGLGLVSLGNKQVDELLGGGLVLGTVFLIETDSFSNFGETLFLYSLSESISMQHETLLISLTTDESNRLIGLLPHNQTLGVKSDISVEESQISKEITKISLLADPKKELNIAWQYAKYLPQMKESNDSIRNTRNVLGSFCCSYDLSKRMQEGLLSTGALQLCYLSDLVVEVGSNVLSAVCDKVLQQIAHFISVSGASTKTNAARIFVPLNDILMHAAMLTAPGVRSCPGQDTVSLARFVLALKNLVRGKHAVVVISLHPDSVSRHLAAKVAQMADSVVAVESFAGRTHSVPYEFKEFHGFLLLAKIQQYGMIAPFRPANSRYGLKRDRRKLHVEPLHLPPEESRAFGAAGTDAQLLARSGGAGASSITQNSGSVTSVESNTIQIHSHHKTPSSSSSLSHDHSHDGHEHHHNQHEEVNKQRSVTLAHHPTSHAPPSVISSASVSDQPAVKMTPLAMKLAAARAARQAGIVADNTASIAPVSIASKSTRPTPPLQPGAACGAGVNSKNNYDF